MAVGQTPITSITANVRVSNCLADPASLSVTTFTPPQTGAEQLDNSPIPTLQVNASRAAPGVNAVGISLVQYTSNPHSGAPTSGSGKISSFT